jgi:hypothetical protein
MSHYRCRDHHDSAVDYRGRGCPECAPHRRSTGGQRRPDPERDAITAAIADFDRQRRYARHRTN